MLKRWLALLLLMVLIPMPAQAQPAPGRVRLLLMDGVHFEHMRGYDNLERLLHQGALALMNVNTGGPRSPESSAVTIGAGSRALGNGAGLVLEGFEEGEEGLAWQTFQRRTGYIPLPGSLVLPEIRSLMDANGQLPYRVEPGYLANRLREGGFTAGALVNSDTNQAFRPGAAIVADGLGTIEKGLVGRQLLTLDAAWPFGLRADIDVFQEALGDFSQVDFLVIDLGDTHRVQAYADLAMPGQREVFRAQALGALDQMVGQLLADHRPGDLLLVAGLQADRVFAGRARHLTPLVVYGWGPGFLTSPTTRREGLVANLDVTATVLNHFGLYRPGEIYGQPLKVVEAQGDLAALLLDDELRMADIFRLRSPYVRGYIGGIILAVFSALAALFFGWRRVGWLRFLVLGLLVTPLILLLLGALPREMPILPIWLVLAALAALGLYRLPPHWAMTGLGAATALAVAGDALIFNAWLQKRSILGYDAIAGARYYGIGNEFMGVLIGSTLLAISPMLARKSWWALPLGGSVILLLMLPGAGANFGGTLAAVAGFAAAAVDWRDLLDKKNRRLAAVLGLAVVAGLILFNLLGDQSHVGRFFRDVGQNPAEILVVAQRKLAMNWKLVRWSLWSRAFAALFAAAVWFISVKRHVVAKYLGGNWRAVRGAMVAAVTALLVNDSGVVAAATTLLYLSFPLIYLQLSLSSSVTASHSV